MGSENSVDLYRTEPGSLAGRYLRSFWQPLYRAKDLPAGEAVPLRRLDDLVAELTPSLPAAPITFLKIDVEGMEMGVLRSATRLLREPRPQIFIELITEAALADIMRGPRVEPGSG